MSAEQQAPAYDAQAEAKRLLRTIRAGSLATLAQDGSPLASLTAVATMPDGTPILLLSRLAAHTRHLEQDGRCSLLLAAGGKGDPLAHPRLSLVGHAAPAGERAAAARARFLARNSKARLYADFPDFSFWHVTLATAHLNGGFARAATFDGADLATSIEGCDDLVAAEDGAVAHMNADHREAIELYATVLAGLPAGAWLISGLDPEGLDLHCGDRTGRVRFPEPVATPGDLRRTLVAMAEAARRTIS